MDVNGRLVINEVQYGNKCGTTNGEN